MNRIRFILATAITLFIVAACGGTAPEVTVEIEAQTTTMAIDGRTQLSATVTGSSNTEVTWSTGDPSIATVDANGIVEANGVAGTVDITATSVADPTKNATVTITVGAFSITAVTITAPSTSVEVGNTLALSAAVSPSSAPQDVTWSSNDSSVATVNNSGVVTGVASGSVTITATSAADIDVSGSITITVVPAGGGGVTAVTIETPPSTQVQEGGEIDLDASVSPSSAPQTVTWSSANTSIATVDSASGLVQGVSAGSVDITAASTADPSFTDSITIEVLGGQITGVTITSRPGGNTLFEGQTFDLEATVTGNGAFGQEVFWVSSSPSVASVDPDTGLVSAITEGTTIIEAFAETDISQSDSFTLTVSSTSVDCSSPTVLNTSTVNGTSTLPLACYVVNDSEVSLSGALTLEPGTVIEFSQGSFFDIELGGSLNAVGTTTAPIIFRGTESNRGWWDGFRFQTASSSNRLENVEISDGGNASSFGNVYVSSGGSVAIVDSTLSNSANSALNLVSGATLSDFSNNTFSANESVALINPNQMAFLDTGSDYASGNDADVVFVRGGNTGTSGTAAWPAINVPFRVTGSQLDITNAVTVQAGAIVEFEQGSFLDVESGGSLTAVGTSTTPVTFRGSQGSRGWWDGMRIQSAGNRLEHTVVAGGGAASSFGNVYVSSSGSVAIVDSVLASSSDAALIMAGTGAQLSEFARNTFNDNAIVAEIFPNDIDDLDSASSFIGDGNNTDATVHIRGGSADDSGSVTWPALDVPYRLIDSELSVSTFVIIEAGATFLIDSGGFVDVESSGAIIADGTSAPIVFTSSAPDAFKSPGSWDGIRFQASGSSLTNVLIEYGGATQANVYLTNGSITIENSTISNSSDKGIYLTAGADGTSTITGNTIADNVIGLEASSANVDADVCTTLNTFTNNGTDCVIN